MKKFLSVACVICAFVTVPVLAAQTLGQVEARTSFSYRLDYPVLNCIFDGLGSADELFAQEDDIKNLYVKTVVVSENNSVVASDETTKHNVMRAGTVCQKAAENVLDYITEFHTETYARARYSNDSMSDDIAMTDAVEIVELARNAKIASTAKNEIIEAEEGYIFVPREQFLKSTTLEIDNMMNLEDKLSFIYGDHFIEAQVGDKLPFGIYVAKDKKHCYVIEQKADGSIIKTNYDLTSDSYEKVSSENVSLQM